MEGEEKTQKMKNRGSAETFSPQAPHAYLSPFLSSGYFPASKKKQEASAEMKSY